MELAGLARQHGLADRPGEEKWFGVPRHRAFAPAAEIAANVNVNARQARCGEQIEPQLSGVDHRSSGNAAHVETQQGPDLGAELDGSSHPQGVAV
jgi:hypothetical protein